jgi:hypothetical protein
MNTSSDELRHALLQAQVALQRGERNAARRWAWRAIALAPEREEPWLLMSALASPRGSVVYLNRALEINPHSKRARQGMHWAIRRLRLNAPARPVPIPQRPPPVAMVPVEALTRTRWPILPLAAIALALVLGMAAWTAFPPGRAAGKIDNVLALNPADMVKPTYTPTPTATFTPTPLPTDTPTPTHTSTETPTPLPTATFTETATPWPSETPLPVNPPEPVSIPTQVIIPPGVGGDERWIDVDLTNQRVYAYQGTELVNNFLVSTGVWNTPTVTGQFQIYAKNPAADMIGPGYYLPNVPYVMYFFKDYGLHGTYWHNNFGTPMSHGCVNLRTEDAAWLFDWAEVGTTVYVH